jgi:hypothetical protein
MSVNDFYVYQNNETGLWAVGHHAWLGGNWGNDRYTDVVIGLQTKEEAEKEKEILEKRL